MDTQELTAGALGQGWTPVTTAALLDCRASGASSASGISLQAEKRTGAELNGHERPGQLVFLAADGEPVCGGQIHLMGHDKCQQKKD